VTSLTRFLLLLGYSLCLALIAMVLEMAARFAQRRSMNFHTVGFVYHPERDIWKCPQDQHLFPIFSDSNGRGTVYRAPATACNSCPSKAACTDSSHGREIKRMEEAGIDFGMRRFHRAVSVTLLSLASLLVLVDFTFTQTLWPRMALGVLLGVFCSTIRQISREMFS
jgi:hypothetical protein